VRHGAPQHLYGGDAVPNFAIAAPGVNRAASQAMKSTAATGDASTVELHEISIRRVK
jgi:hypothetical protein